MEIRDNLRTNLLEFSMQAFNMLPKMEKPSILDVGCGTGMQTIELAKMSDGHITAIDIDVPALMILQRKIKELGLSHRFSIMQVNMLNVRALNKTFDVIWAEGSIYAIGFERGLRDWKDCLRKDGYLVIHDEDDRIETKLHLINNYGFELIGRIDVPHETWEERYYKPLLEVMSTRKLADSEIINFRKELDTFKRTKMGSVFFILQSKSI